LILNLAITKFRKQKKKIARAKKENSTSMLWDMVHDPFPNPPQDLVFADGIFRMISAHSPNTGTSLSQSGFLKGP
jgi:hypothetical protein